MLQRLLLFLSVLVVAAGIAQRFRSSGSLHVSSIAAPTATPIAAACDETVETRELTLEACEWYAIQTGIFSSEQTAQQRADAYSDRGAPGIVIQDGAKWRVLIACYADKADATAVRDKLAADQQVETWLHTWSCPSVTLRMTGMAGQLDMAEAGLSFAMQAARRLRDTATALDAGEASTDDAIAVIADLQQQAGVWCDTTYDRFAKPYPVLIAEEIKLMQLWQTLAQSLRTKGDESITALSGAMKCSAMQLYDAVATMRCQLVDS